jgi:hypothetical protein
MQLSPLKEAAAYGKIAMYEHYYDVGSISQVTLNDAGQVKWKYVADDRDREASSESAAAAYERITGEPMPDFAAIGWGPQMTARGEEQWHARGL